MAISLLSYIYISLKLLNNKCLYNKTNKIFTSCMNMCFLHQRIYLKFVFDCSHDLKKNPSQCKVV